MLGAEPVNKSCAVYLGQWSHFALIQNIEFCIRAFTGSIPQPKVYKISKEDCIAVRDVSYEKIWREPEI